MAADIDEVIKRLDYLEREIAHLKRDRMQMNPPPLIDPSFVKEVVGAAAVQCKHDKITQAMLEGMEEYGHSGVSVQAAIYQDPESGKRIWYTNTIPVQELLQFPLEEVMGVLSPLANLHRLRILSMLIKGNKSASEISKEMDIHGGQLYHHLDYLLGAHYIRKVNRGLYSIDMDGWRALFTVAQLGWYIRVKAPELDRLLEQKRKKETHKQ
jgi:DNA-binding transcriptional ArsR family regulator